MRKKIIPIALAFAIVLSMLSVAYAVPSKTTPDMVKPVELTSTTGVTMKPDFVIETSANDPKTESILAEIYELVTVKLATPVEYFSKDVQVEIVAKLPAGTNIKNLKMNELVAIETRNFDSSYGDVEVKLQVASYYRNGQSIVALVGYLGADGEMVWVPIDTVVEDGNVKCVFPQELLEQINNGTATLALLSE